MNCQLQFVMLTAPHVRQAKSKVCLSREFCTLDLLKSCVTKFPLRPYASLSPRFFAHYNRVQFTFPKRYRCFTAFYGTPLKKDTPTYVGGSIAAVAQQRELRLMVVSVEKGGPRRKESLTTTFQLGNPPLLLFYIL